MKYVPYMAFLVIVCACSCKTVYPVQPFSSRIRSNPDEADRYFNRGIAHYSLKQYGPAANVFAEAVRIEPLDSAARIWLGLSYAFIDSLSDAAQALNPEYPFNNAGITNTERGLALRVIGHTEEAIEAYYKALRVNEPHPGLLHSKIGANYYNLGRYDDAIPEFQEVINYKHEAAIKYNSYVNLAHSYYHSGNYEKAIEAYLAVIDCHPAKKGEALLGIGNANYQLGNTDEACRYYTKTIECDNSITDAYYNLCLISIRHYKNAKTAVMYYNRLAERAPDSAKRLYPHLQSLAAKQ